MEITSYSVRELVSMVREYNLSRGIAYLLAKGHRISGSLLGLYLIAHIYTMAGLTDPAKFQREMDLLSHPFFMFLEWCLVIPLAFHAFNGARLILFELYHQHEDALLIRWSLTLSSIFALFMGILMLVGTESVSTGMFWAGAFMIMLLLVYIIWRSVWPTFNKNMWKLQRITGAGLISLALGHYFFMHLNVATGHHAETIIARMQNPFIIMIDFVLLTLVIFHAWYGVLTMITDDLVNRLARNITTGLLTLAALALYIAGINLLIQIVSL
ncbi:hypothetical protein JXQ70_02140 [bacterium]|nr:hypothetical protein [bacterium]